MNISEKSIITVQANIDKEKWDNNWDKIFKNKAKKICRKTITSTQKTH